MELRNAPLANVIDALARQLGINYVLDTRTAAGVSITTHGGNSGADAREVLDVILLGSRAKLVETKGGELQIPAFQVSWRTTGLEERVPTTLHVVFLKDMTADTLSELIVRLAGRQLVEAVHSASGLLVMTVHYRS